MNIGIITLFPGIFYTFLNTGIVGRSVAKGALRIKLWNLSKFNASYDGIVCGQNSGILLQADTLKQAFSQIHQYYKNNIRRIYLSP